MRKAWLVLGGFMLGVVITATVTPRFGTVALPTARRHVTMAERELDRVVARIDLNAVPFDRAVDDVRKLTSAKIEIDDAALNQIRFDRQTPVTVHGTGVTLGQVLGRLIPHEDGKVPQVGYCVVDGRIVLTSADELARTVTLRCYDVRDVLRSPTLDDDPYNRPFDLNARSPIGAARERDDEYRARSLIRLLEDTVATETWSDNGGSVGAAYCLSGRLFVTQSWAAHHQIEYILEQLRAPELPPPPPLVEKPWSRMRNAWIAPAEIERQEALIRKALPRIAFGRTPFNEAIESLRRMSGVDIRLDSKALTSALFSQNTPVSLHLADASLAYALDVLLSEPIGTAGREEGIDRLVAFLRKSVDTETWKDEGGATGRIYQSHGRLIITQTWQSHEKIARWLDMLREIGWNVAAPPPSVPAASEPSSVPRSGT